MCLIHSFRMVRYVQKHFNSYLRLLLFIFPRPTPAFAELVYLAAFILCVCVCPAAEQSRSLWRARPQGQ